MHRTVDYKVRSNNTSPVPKSQEASQKMGQEEPKDQEVFCENLCSKNDTEVIPIYLKIMAV